MKKFISLLIAIILIASSVFITPVFAAEIDSSSIGVEEYETDSEGNVVGRIGENATYVFEPENSTLTISGSGTLGCKEKINGSYIDSTKIYYWYEPVKEAKKVTFNGNFTKLSSGLFNNFKSLETIALPDSIESIIDITNGLSLYGNTKGLFNDCTNLEKVILPKNITSLPQYCFRGCSSLSYIDIPDSVKSIGSGCFSGCSSLKTINLPNNITSIPSYCFANSGIKYINLSKNLLNIEDCAFQNCKNLLEIDLSQAKIVKINDYTFNGCTHLAKINLPNTCKTLGKGCFSDSGLDNFSMPNSITNLGDGIFANCTNLQKIYLSSDLKSLPSNTFSKCNRLIEVGMPSKLKSIGSSCFSNCSNLKSIELPENLESLGEGCFSGCTSLLYIEIPENVTELPSYCFDECSNLKEISLGKNIETIHYYCFGYCEKLKYINLPDGLLTMEDDSFYETGLTYLVIPKTCAFNPDAFPSWQVPKTLIVKSNLIESDIDHIHNYKDFNKTCIYTYAENENLINWCETHWAYKIINQGEEPKNDYNPQYITTEEEPTLLKMDTDGDGNVSITDATTIQRYLAEFELPYFNAEAADADGNGYITIYDVTYIQRYIAGLPCDILQQ